MITRGRKKPKKNPVYAFAALFVILLLLGGSLIFLTLKYDISGIYRFFLILAGAGAAATGAGAILHNAIGALIGMISGKKDVEEPVFFVIGLIGGPIAFLTGTIGSVIIFVRNLAI